jgi:putative heme-binding domain-containing protein
MVRWALAAGLLLLPAAHLRAADAPKLELKPGDHLSLIGNTLADRMQHDGWLETLLQARFPNHKLVIRNLGFSADELTVRLRSADFGTPDQWLAKNRTNVVLAFFGYNESFGDLAKFRKDLDAFLDHTLAQKYDGQSPPRVVLFSPIAHEDLGDPHLPDGKANNARLEAITKVMAEAAAAKGVAFVDLFRPTQTLYTQEKAPLTINGIHLNEQGNKLLAGVIDRALFPGAPAPKLTDAQVEALRAGVKDKNHVWFNRYRTVDGYSMYGGRADLKFVGGQTNRVVMDRELEVLDVMTANRDERIWALAQGKDKAVNDENTPPFIPVVTNKPGDGPNGTHLFLDGEDAIKKMTVAKGLKVQLFASEKDFPEMVNPVQMAFDPKGRLWVAVWPTYPHWKPKAPMNDKILIYEDTNGDGKADRQTVFADDLHCPTGFEFARGGVLVAQAPDLMFLKDTDGDGKADVRERVLSGLDSADTHHTSNSFTIDPGGALYFQEGTFHHTQVETPFGPPERVANGAVFRYEPRSQKFEVYVSFPFANPHGHAFDRWGQDIVIDGTGSNPYHAALFSGRVEFPSKHGRPPQVYQQRTRPCPGIEFLASRHFPDDYQGNLLVGNVIGFQGILRYRVDEKGASLGATELEPLLSSTDPNFRPTDIEVGPDGAIYFIDWQNPIIGHMQHNLRDPSRDVTHGRVYRVTHEGRDLLKPPAVAGSPIESLLEILKQPEDRLRHRARLELATRDPKAVIAALGRWVEALDKADPQYEHQMLEALWLHQNLDDVNVELLDRMLKSSESRARAAATRVLCYWRDRVPGALDRLKALAADPYPRVRLEAVRAASFFKEPEALEIALISADQPSDEYIDFVRAEALKTLEPYWKKAVSEGQEIAFTSDAGARFFLRTVGTEDLLKLKRTRGVLRELMVRPGVREEDRRRALADLAAMEKSSQAQALLGALSALDKQDSDLAESVVLELSRLFGERPAAELAAVRPELERLATGATLPALRPFAFAALVGADGNADAAWTLAEKSAPGLRDLLGAMPLVRDPAARAAMFPRIAPLLDGLPPALATPSKGTTGRFVRIELPGRRRTLTLAEVEVTSDGRNIARAGKASQSSTSNGGDAAKAIDGNSAPSFGAGGQTHSREGEDSPWWEVDLGAEVPIDAIVIYNRNEGNLGRRLNNFTVKVLDAARQTVFEKTGQPAPEIRATLALGGGGPEGMVRRAAMTALTYIPGQEAAAFGKLATFVQNGTDRNAAVAAMLRLPRGAWPADAAPGLLSSVIGYVRGLPVADRTTPQAVDALQLGDALASLLPPDQARPIRKQLGELGVRVLRVGTVLEQMRYDAERLVAAAGKPVEIRFDNSDLMPHNFVVTQPGALQEVGELAEATATQPGALERQYVPPSPKVLLASKLLQPREAQVLNFNAPKEPGVYPYVCTYPGHWRRMYGAFYVVADLDEYLADPEGYLAAHPMEIKDELLKFTRPRKEWTYDELASSVQELEGRSFRSGQGLFQSATCVSCHKLGATGIEVGPNLAGLMPKRTPAEHLRSLLDPSEKIEEKYRSTLFELESGQVVSGLIVEETPEVVKVLENPLAKAEPTVLNKAQITARQPSTTSIMPKGLLDKLTREEILDLVAYITAEGRADHPFYKNAPGGAGGHDHHNH